MDNQQQPQQASGFPTKIGQPATRALVNAGYTQLAQLTKVSATELKQLHGMGPKAIGILSEALATKGMAFVPDPPKQAKR